MYFLAIVLVVCVDCVYGNVRVNEQREGFAVETAKKYKV